LGVPRIKEIINAAKNISTPIITAPLAINDSLPAARIVKGRIELTKLGEICEYMEEIYSCDGATPPQLLIKIDMNVIKQLQLEIDIEGIALAISKYPKNKAPMNRIQVVDEDRILIKVPQQTSGRSLPYFTGKIAKLAIERNYENARSGYFSLQHLKRIIPFTPIIGISSVNRAVINDIGGKRYNLLVEGAGLKQVMITPGIIGSTCTSNNVMEVEQVLGIEAARSTIAHEIQYTMAKHGMTIDPRHVTLLTDLMTTRGLVLGITRYGVARLKDDSVLMLASFEKTTDHLFDAARYGRTDKIEGVSESIIMGVPMPIGTGSFKLIQQIEPGSYGPRQLLFDRPELHKHPAY
jgi:DNA-directed RNA polymerase III subunit RPC1